MKLAIIVGTRPQIIKSAPVYEAFVKAGIQCDLVNTGQHYDYDMNRQFFKELELPEPDVDLNVGPGTPTTQVSGIVGALGGWLDEEKPSLVVIPGDTNSALAAGIACSKEKVPIAHLEAGCRSWDRWMSEEVNRRVLDHISDVLLCPTPACLQNLRNEQVTASVVRTVGDTMLDSIIKYETTVRRRETTRELGLNPGSFVFMTLHRAENVDSTEVLSAIMEGIGAFREPVLFSVHPRTDKELRKTNQRIPPNVTTTGPLPYLDTLKLITDCKFVVTDSGGLQKEAFWLRKPTLIPRETTEWMEIIQAGSGFLVGKAKQGILDGYRKLEGLDQDSFEKAPTIFGDGSASPKVVDAVTKYLGGN